MPWRRKKKGRREKKKGEDLKERGEEKTVPSSSAPPFLIFLFPPPLPERRRTPKSISHMSFCCYSSWGSSVKVLKVKKEFRLPQRCYLLIFSPTWLLKRRNASFLANYALLLDLGRQAIRASPNKAGPKKQIWITGYTFLDFRGFERRYCPPGGDFADY